MLNPLLLWFLPLAALPVLLHLLNLYRLREVELPTYRFLMEGYVQQRRRIRLVEWLLMLLRTAIVLLAVWALSRPVVERFGSLFGGGRSRDVAFVVDAGMTTGLVQEGTTALHRSREAVRAAAFRLQPSDFVTLVRAGMEPKVLYRAALGDGKRFAAELETLEPDPGTADLAAGLAEASAGPPRGPRTVWLVSDCERRGWRRLAEPAPAPRVPEDTQLVVLDVAAAATSVRNIAVLGDPPRSQRPVVGLPVELTIRVEASGHDVPVETKATVRLDDDIVAQVPIVLPPGRVTTHTLAIVPPRAGVLQGRVEIPADLFPEDDTLLFVLNVEPRVGVLVIAPPGLEPIFDPALFLRAALDSPRETAAATREDTGAARPGQPPAGGDEEIARSLDVTVARSDSVDEKKLRAADVIFLVEQRLDGARLKWLRERVEAGAGLVVIAGSHKHGSDDLRGLLSSDGKQADSLPLGLGKAVGNVDDETAARSLATVDVSHPIFAAFRPSGATANAAAEASAFDTLRVFRHEPLELHAPSDAAGDTARRRQPALVLARLDDGSAVVAETRLGRGRVIVSGLPVTPDWSNLPVHPSFVPIMLRMVQHVRPEPPAVAVESVHPYEPAPIRLNDAWRRAVVQAIGPAGGRRPIETVAGDDGVTGALDDTRTVGFYEFDVEPPAGSTISPLRLGMSVNRDVETAAFEHVPAAEVAAAFAPHPVMQLSSTAEDPTLHAQLTGRREIWRWLIFGLFGIFGLEFLLSTLRPPTPVGAGGPARSWSQRINDWLARAVGNTGDAASA
jgi:hypothetical protein